MTNTVLTTKRVARWTGLECDGRNSTLRFTAEDRAAAWNIYVETSTRIPDKPFTECSISDMLPVSNAIRRAMAEGGPFSMAVADLAGAMLVHAVLPMEAAAGKGDLAGANFHRLAALAWTAMMRAIAGGSGDTATADWDKILAPVAVIPRVLVDETDDGLDERLRNEGYDAYSVKKLRSSGYNLKNDSAVVSYARDNDMVLVTRDKGCGKRCANADVKCVLVDNENVFRMVLGMLDDVTGKKKEGLADA